jgi:lipoate-protein ligase A
MRRWRLIADGAADGATNMAADDALLDAAAERRIATLRLYTWRPPCLSLGYFQPLSDVDRAACAAAGVTLVRRPTGGRAVLHADELTYAVAGPLDSPPFDGSVVETYQRIAAALVAGLAALGLRAESTGSRGVHARSGPACFDTAGAHEITVDGRKLIGSAQTRRGGALLQHGALPIGGDPGAVIDLLAIPRDQRAALRARLAARSTTLEQALGRRPDPWTIHHAIVHGFTQTLGVELVVDELTAAERAYATRARAERYADPAWLARR